MRFCLMLAIATVMREWKVEESAAASSNSSVLDVFAFLPNNSKMRFCAMFVNARFHR